MIANVAVAAATIGEMHTINLSWLNALAAFAATQVDRVWYRPYPGATFVTDADFVMAADDEWLIIWAFYPRLIHVSQLDEPMYRRDDPDRRAINNARCEASLGNPNILPRHIS